jgi:hypothetical protein
MEEFILARLAFRLSNRRRIMPPLPFPVVLIPPPNIRLLIVLDGSTPTPGLAGSFGKEVGGQGYNWFGLTHVLAALSQSTAPTITVTKAHRQTDPGSSDPTIVNNFVFNENLVASYDVIWLIGCTPWNYGEGDPPGVSNPVADEQNYVSTNISAQEVANITAFMNAGGGIFATGDHGSFGAAIAGQVPRVRLMRPWFVTEDPTTSAPPAITDVGTQVSRISTVQPNPFYGILDKQAVELTQPQNDATLPPSGNEATDIPFENQSDDIPTPITAKRYIEPVLFPDGGRGVEFNVPHPLLDLGALGVLDHMPDHMHEGKVALAEGYATATLPDGGYEFPELSSDHAQPLPEIIATGTSMPEEIWIAYGASTGFSGDTHPGFSGSYGVVGAYDGQPLGVGRIAVDSTFHHFFDVNLIGDQDLVYEAQQGFDPDAYPLDPRSQGFPYSTSGQAYLAKFDSYYQNLAIWLANPEVIVVRFPYTLWRMLYDVHLREALGLATQTPARRRDLGRLALRHLHRAGLTRTGLIDDILALVDYQILPPWFAGRPGERPVLGAAEAHHMMSHVLGLAMAAVHREQAAIAGDEKPVERLTALVRAAVREGLADWRDELAASNAALSLRAALDRMLAQQ